MKWYIRHDKYTCEVNPQQTELKNLPKSGLNLWCDKKLWSGENTDDFYRFMALLFFNNVLFLRLQHKALKDHVKIFQDIIKDARTKDTITINDSNPKYAAQQTIIKMTELSEDQKKDFITRLKSSPATVVLREARKEGNLNKRSLTKRKFESLRKKILTLFKQTVDKIKFETLINCINNLEGENFLPFLKNQNGRGFGLSGSSSDDSGSSESAEKDDKSKKQKSKSRDTKKKNSGDKSDSKSKKKIIDKKKKYDQFIILKKFRNNFQINPTKIIDKIQYVLFGFILVKRQKHQREFTCETYLRDNPDYYVECCKINGETLTSIQTRNANVNGSVYCYYATDHIAFKKIEHPIIKDTIKNEPIPLYKIPVEYGNQNISNLSEKKKKEIRDSEKAMLGEITNEFLKYIKNPNLTKHAFFQKVFSEKGIDILHKNRLKIIFEELKNKKAKKLNFFQQTQILVIEDERVEKEILKKNREATEKKKSTN